MWIWAPPESALDENGDTQKEDFFIAAQSFEFIFEEPRPPANYDTGFNYIIEKNETTVSDISKGTRKHSIRMLTDCRSSLHSQEAGGGALDTLPPRLP